MATPKTKPPVDDQLEDSGDDTVIGRALWISLGVVVLAGVVVAGLIVFRPEPEEPEEKQTDVREAKKRRRTSIDGKAAAAPKLPAFRFTDITKEAGINFVHENGASPQKLLPETMGGGVAFFDYDNDGDPDLLFVNFKRWEWETGNVPLLDRPGKAGSSNGKRTAGRSSRATMALYENDGSGRFKNVTNGSGLDVSLYGMGVACGDYDNDGLTDLYITTLHENRLFRNKGQGKFEDVTKTAGVAGGKNDWSTSAGFFDYDNDGDLDLFVCNYVAWTKEFDIGQNFNLIGGGRAYGAPQMFPGSACRLFRNEGNGKFSDVSKTAGVQVLNSRKIPFGKSLGVCFTDTNRDGYLDVFVANDTVHNFLFRNNGNGTFTETATAAGVAYDTQGKPRGAMGIDAGWFRNNDEIGIAIGNFSNEMTALYVSHGGRELFTDDAVSNGIGPVTRQELTFGLFFFDADLDGRLDIFAANGHLEKDIQKVQARQSYEQPPQLLWNGGPGFNIEFLPVVAPLRPVREEGESDTDFEKRLAAWKKSRTEFQKRMGDFTKPMVGRGAAFADIDRDGDLDIVIVGGGQPPRLLRNDQKLGHNWLQVKVNGLRTPKTNGKRESNRSAIGALVEVHLPGGKVLRQRVMPTRSYLSQVELPLTFGLGEAKSIEKLVVTWPSGKRVEMTSEIPINSRIGLTEPVGEPQSR